MKLEKFAKGLVAGTLVLCGVFAAATGEAAYTVIRCVNKNGNNEDRTTRALKRGVSQKDAAKLISSFRIIGEADAYEDACLAGFVDYWRPSDLRNIKTLRLDESFREWLDANEREGFKTYWNARRSASHSLSSPQPFSNHDGSASSFPYFFLIADEPVYQKNDKGEAVGLDVEKTKFAGRFEQILPIATFNGLLYDSAGMMPDDAENGGRNALYPLIDFLTANDEANVYIYNAKGEKIIQNKDLQMINTYSEGRFDRSNTAPKTLSVMKARKLWDEAKIKELIKTLVNGALNSPTSKAPAFTPETQKRLARLKAAGIAKG